MRIIVLYFINNKDYFKLKTLGIQQMRKEAFWKLSLSDPKQKFQKNEDSHKSFRVGLFIGARPRVNILNHKSSLCGNFMALTTHSCVDKHSYLLCIFPKTHLHFLKKHICPSYRSLSPHPHFPFSCQARCLSPKF